MRRFDIKSILADPEKRKVLLVGACLAIQHREGIETTREQMAAVYDAVQRKSPESVR